MRSTGYGILARMVSGLLAFALVALPQQGASASSVRYAKPAGVSSGSCSTWATACKLPRALSVAVAGDQVWVAKGVYRPAANDRTKSFHLKNGVAIYGGFAGTETLVSQRKWGVNYTTLTGEIGNPYPDISDNSYHVVVGGTAANPTNSTAVLDGFYIIYGYASGGGIDSYGAGILNWNSSPTLRNLEIEMNTVVAIDGDAAGAGIANFASSPHLTNVMIFGNQALVTGSHNTGGAGMYNLNSSPVMNKVQFLSNQAVYGAGLYNTGGSMPRLTNAVFKDNSASAEGGGMYSNNSSPLLTLTNVTFENNSAQWGGAISNNVSNPTLNNVTFSGNTAVSSGGAMYNYMSGPTLTNATLSGNTASTADGMDNHSSLPYIYNSILWGDGSTEIVDDSFSIATIENSILKGGCAGVPGATCSSTNVYDADPQLGPLHKNGGFVKTMALGVNSFAIDWGNDATCTLKDARGLARPQGWRCDIGAYEVRTATFVSQAAYDGWVLESAAGTGIGGGTPNTTATTIRLGDDALNRQYRAFFSFDTSAIPDTASVVNAMLMAKKTGMVGDTSSLTWIRLDQQNPYFGSMAGLGKGDFQAPEDYYAGDLASFSPDWYATRPITGGLFPDSDINKTGTTQFRASFGTASDGDLIADYLTFYSGNAATVSNRPKLIVYYNP